MKLSCQSAPKTYELEINIKKQPKFFETDAESEKRRRLKLLGDKELDITDFVKQYPRTVALALFVKKLQENLIIKRQDQNKYTKQNKTPISKEKIQSKIDHKLDGMRNGENFHFTTLETEIKAYEPTAAEL